LFPISSIQDASVLILQQWQRNRSNIDQAICCVLCKL